MKKKPKLTNLKPGSWFIFELCENSMPWMFCYFETTNPKDQFDPKKFSWKTGGFSASLTISQWSCRLSPVRPSTFTTHTHHCLGFAANSGAMELEWGNFQGLGISQIFRFLFFVILFFKSSNQEKSSIWGLWNKSLNIIFPTNLCHFPKIYGQTERQKSWFMCADVWNLLSLKRKLLKLNEGDFGTVPIWGDLG